MNKGLNKLYALLVSGIAAEAASDAYYIKRFTHTAHTERSSKLLEQLVQNVPDSRRHLLACVICTYARYTCFWKDIQALDANNTYNAFVRNPSADGMAANECVYDMTCPANELLNRVKRWLDTDITDQLAAASWIEVAAGVCLQMLREASANG